MGILQEISLWATETFPTKDVPDFYKKLDGLIIHMEREIEELKDNPQDVLEAADIIILAAHFIGLQGYNPDDVVAGKHGVNKLRKWKEPDGQGVVEHEE